MIQNLYNDEEFWLILLYIKISVYLLDSDIYIFQKYILHNGARVWI